MNHQPLVINHHSSGGEFHAGEPRHLQRHPGGGTWGAVGGGRGSPAAMARCPTTREAHMGRDYVNDDG